MRKLLKSRKALSPVVAAIILIAVTVAVSIAVAAWMGALTFTFMKTEELKITNHTWAVGATATSTNVTLTVRNSGTARLTISELRVNDAVVTAGAGGWEVVTAGADEILEPGEQVDVRVYGSGVSGGFVAGTRYEFAIITATGNKFTYTAVAPS